MIDKIKKEIQRQLQESEERLSHIKARGFVAPNEEQLIVHLKGLLSFINTLEVKEVDLEKEIKEYLSTYWPKEIELHPFLGHMAKHFFELGLRLQTETNITFKYNIGESVREYKAQKENQL